MMSRSPEDWKDERMKCLEARGLLYQALAAMDEYNEFHNGDEKVLVSFEAAANNAIGDLNMLIGMNTIGWEGA